MERGASIGRVAVVTAALVALSACGRAAEDDDDYAAVVPTTAAAPTTTTTVVQDPAYVVQAGDSLSVIAARFSVTVDEIAQANGITDVDSITAGDELVIPPSSGGTPPGPGTTTGSTAPTSTAGSVGSAGSPGTTRAADGAPADTADSSRVTSTTAGATSTAAG